MSGLCNLGVDSAATTDADNTATVHDLIRALQLVKELNRQNRERLHASEAAGSLLAGNTAGQ
jgi:hypothetical protein